MPARNAIKNYASNSYYHIYNRGVEKRKIFIDKQDYSVFLSYLKIYLMPKDVDELRKKLFDPNIYYKDKDKIIRLINLNNFADEIKLIAYCLMPNHFHFLIKQNNPYSIDKFMNSLGTRYTMYFNRRYKRVGPLYQGVYKAVCVTHEEQLLDLTRYIHQQALNIYCQPIQPSSYFDYIGETKTVWVHPEDVLSLFSKMYPNHSYTHFVSSEPSSELASKGVAF